MPRKNLHELADLLTALLGGFTAWGVPVGILAFRADFGVPTAGLTRNPGVSTSLTFVTLQSYPAHTCNYYTSKDIQP